MHQLKLSEGLHHFYLYFLGSEAPWAQMCMLIWCDSPAPQSGPSWWGPSANTGKRNYRLKEKNVVQGPANTHISSITLQRRPADASSRNPAQMC